MPMDPATKQQAPEAPEMSLSDAIAEQYDEMEAELEAPADDEVEQDQQPEKAAERRDRDTEKTEDPEHSDDPEASASGEDDETPYDEPAPERWPADLKAAYAEMPPEAKKTFMERVFKPMQSSYTRKTQELTELQKQLDPMMRTLQDHREIFEARGLSAEQAFRDQIAWAAHFARVGPQQGLADMQRAFNVNPAGGQQAESDLSDEWLTPTEKALKQEVLAMKEQLGQTASSIQEREQQAIRHQQMQEQMRGTQQDLAQFASETTPDGAVKHPYLSDVAQTMAGLLRGGLVAKTDDYGNPRPMQEQLSDAYQMAVRADATVQAKIQQTSSQARQAKLVTAASRDIPSKGVAGSVDVQAGPITDTISDIYDQLAAGRR